MALAGVVGVLGAHRLAAADRGPVGPSTATTTSLPDGGRGVGSRLPGSSPDHVVYAAALGSVAKRWVTALWTRPPGDPPFAWLDRVADITAPDLDAELRTARQWLDGGDVIASSVDVIGVYPDAGDRATLTVTCIAHRVTEVGAREEACATTVTVAAAADGRLVVAAVR